MNKYTIGIDYGSLSGRTVLVRCDTGEVVAESTLEYPHAVMDTALPDARLWARTGPFRTPDYLDVLYTTIPAVLKESGVDSADIIGVGTDFTACTVLPVKADGTPLCFLPQFRSTPNAYVKLWKHHAAEKYANRLTEIARQRGEAFLDRYGGKISSEWEIPKTWQILDESRRSTRPPTTSWRRRLDRLAADWRAGKNTCAAGYKVPGTPRTATLRGIFQGLDPRLANYVSEKMNFPIAPLGKAVGGVTEEMAARTGLKAGTPVSSSIIDAHVAMPSAGITGPGQLLAIMGTSTCDILLSEESASCPASAAWWTAASTPASTPMKQASPAWATTSPGSWTTAAPHPIKRTLIGRARTSTSTSRSWPKSCAPARAALSLWTGGTATAAFWRITT